MSSPLFTATIGLRTKSSSVYWMCGAIKPMHWWPPWMEVVPSSASGTSSGCCPLRRVWPMTSQEPCTCQAHMCLGNRSGHGLCRAERETLHTIGSRELL